MGLDVSVGEPLSGANLSWFAAKMVLISIVLSIVISLGVLSLANAFDLLPVPFEQAFSYSVLMAWLVGGGVALIVAIGLSDAFSHLALSRARFEELSRTDSLTGLFNRRAFNQFFEETAEEATLAIFDVDRFKAINDNFGHAVGDCVIQSIAHCIADTFGSCHSVARIGGEEFAVIIRGGDFADRFTLAELTRLRISKLAIDLDGCQLSPTVSVGMAEISAQRSKNDIFVVADKALYLAKSAGRNRVYHESELGDLDTARLQSLLLAVS